MLTVHRAPLLLGYTKTIFSYWIARLYRWKHQAKELQVTHSLPDFFLFTSATAAAAVASATAALSRIPPRAHFVYCKSTANCESASHYVRIPSTQADEANQCSNNVLHHHQPHHTVYSQLPSGCHWRSRQWCTASTNCCFDNHLSMMMNIICQGWCRE